ncbi:MAG: hypothetical protein DRP74_04870 [Candidatus Omnitrophota bacterium]|nr:MAG: hypothetical protein DRP74_04870 [Candidatus Omnitrophota bacterium]
MSLCRSLKGRIKINEPLKYHTTFKLGGPAQFFAEPRNYQDLKSLLGLVKVHRKNLHVLGLGSNILVSDKGVKGVVLSLNSPFFKKISFKNNYYVDISAGATLSRAVRLSAKRSLSGLEFLSGIPASLGGALVMNAGVTRRKKTGRVVSMNIGDIVKEVTVMDCEGNIKTLKKKDINFKYRYSELSKYIVLKARFLLKKDGKRRIKNRIKDFLSWRKITQEQASSAGCIFKNPAGKYAGRLIDRCGLKGKKVGGAQVSLKHANFIINKGGAKTEDVLKLIYLMRKKVKEKFNVDLKLEVKIWR